MTTVKNAQIQVQSFFDPATWTISHVVHAGKGTACAIVDSVLDYDPKSGRTSTVSADKLINFVKANELSVEWHLESHAHADHLSAAPYLKKNLGGRTAIGKNITVVQGVFKNVFNLEPEFKQDGSQFDHLFADGEVFNIGSIEAKVMSTPGHTPACSVYVMGNNVFVGDTIFMPDVGTARCDFPGGDAHTLFQSVQKLLAMPEDTKLYLCHDYPPAGREAVMFTTVGEQRAKNIHVRLDINEEQFIAMRTARDKTLEMPTLILPAVQINIRAGELPPAEANGVAYVKIPLNVL
jgi:glyoxylase-like metal-dependent hydrolase (beta-lactamase superfamily II)